MFVTTASATSTLVVANAKVTAVTSGTSFTYQMPTGTTASGTLTSFTAYKSLQFLGGGLTRFQQTSSDAGAIASGSLILGNNTGLNNIGTASLVIPSDGELVFNNAASPKYLGGGNLFSRSGSNDIATSGDFEIGISDTSTQGAIIFKGGSGGSIRAFSATAGNDSIGIYNTSGSAFGFLVAENFYPGGQGSAFLTHDGNFNFNDSVDVTGNVTATGSLQGSTIYSTSAGLAFVGSTGGDLFLTGADTSVPISGNGEVTAIPNTTTATTNSARWVFISGNTYGLRRDSSTRRVKTNIVQADEGVLAAAKRLRAVHFEPLEKDEDGNLRGTGQLTLGLIAEEILEAGLGCAVTYDAEGLPDGYDERVLMAAMLHHISDLEARLAALENA
jgi:hypothetical protein